MLRRRAAVVVLAVGVVAYLGGFLIDHLSDYERSSEGGQRLIEALWDASLLLPLVAVGVAVHLWPRWRVVLGIVAFMFVWPLGVHEVEIAIGAREPLGGSCDPCIDTRILSGYALPALLVGLVSLGAARWRRRRRPRSPGASGR